MPTTTKKKKQPTKKPKGSISIQLKDGEEGRVDALCGARTPEPRPSAMARHLFLLGLETQERLDAARVAGPNRKGKATS